MCLRECLCVSVRIRVWSCVLVDICVYFYLLWYLCVSACQIVCARAFGFVVLVPVYSTVCVSARFVWVCAIVCFRLCVSVFLW